MEKHDFYFKSINLSMLRLSITSQNLIYFKYFFIIFIFIWISSKYSYIYIYQIEHEVLHLMNYFNNLILLILW